jgi:hypothetical protein
MSPFDHDPELVRLGEQERLRVVRRVEELGAQLRREGWDFVCIKLTRLIERGGMCAAPGSSLCQFTPQLLPGIPLEASELRQIADTIERTFAESGCAEAIEGYSEEVRPGQGVAS